MLNPRAKRFLFKAINLGLVSQFLFMFTNTFFVLYALSIVSYTDWGIILAIQLFIQAVTDYPTGAVGDWIGQRWVLTIAAFFYSAGFLFLSQATDFLTLTIAFILLALANGQNSGAFQTWLDNNYKLYAPEDADRRVYTESLGKFMMISQLMNAFAFITGGIVVVTIGRSNAFIMQGISIIFLAFALFFLIRDHPELERSKTSFGAYFSLLGEGITTTMRNKTIRLILIGVTIAQTGMIIWGNFILFPLYESYGKTDDMTALIRAVIYIAGAIMIGIMAVVSKKIHDTRKWLAFAVVITDVIFFWGILFMININPAPALFQIIPVLILIITFSLVGIPRMLQAVLMPRFYLDIIPDKNRNSIYSLLPTVVLGASVITTFFGGYIVDILGDKLTILGIGVVALIGGIIVAKGILSHDIEDSQPEMERKSPLELGERVHEGAMIFFSREMEANMQILFPSLIPVRWHAARTVMDIRAILIEIILADGAVTEEEQVLLERILSDLNTYAEILEKAMEDNLITTVEKRQLKDAREKIWTGAHGVAAGDRIISDDEQSILLKLVEVIRKLPIDRD